jgi:hypothetical protein
MPLIDDFVRDDEVVFGIDHRLYVVADDPGSTTACAHGTRIRVGQRHLALGSVVDSFGHPLQELHLTAQASDLLADLVDPYFRNITVFPVSAVKGDKIAIDARLDPTG